MVENDLKILEDLVRRLRDGGWEGQARWLSQDIAVTQRELSPSTRRARSAVVVEPLEFGRGWAQIVGSNPLDPPEARRFLALELPWIDAARSLESTLRRNGRYMTAHRWRALALYLGALYAEQAGGTVAKPYEPVDVDSALVKVWYVAAQRGYPFEATGLHLMGETTPELFKTTRELLGRRITQAFGPWTQVTHALATSGYEPVRSPSVPRIELDELESGVNWLSTSSKGQNASLGLSPVSDYFSKGGRINWSGDRVFSVHADDPEVSVDKGVGDVTLPMGEEIEPPVQGPQTDGPPDPGTGGGRGYSHEVGGGEPPMSHDPEPTGGSGASEPEEGTCGAEEPDAPKEQETKQFQFSLTGDAVSGRQVAPESTFELRFSYGEVDENAIAPVTGRHFNDGLKRDQELRLTIHAPGFTFVDGRFSQPVIFKRGQLEPVVFKMTAPESAEAAQRDVWARFSKDGYTLYQLNLRLIVAPLDQVVAGRESFESIDLDRWVELSRTRGPTRQANLVLTADSDRISISLTLHDLTRPGYSLSPVAHAAVTKFSDGQLLDKLQELEQILRCKLDQTFWNEPRGADLSQDVDGEPDAAETVERFAGAGSELWSFLCRDGAIKQCLEAIDALPDGCRVAIRTRHVFIPWEILNPAPFNYALPEEAQETVPQRQRFWGYRFKLEAFPLDPAPSFDAPVSGGKGPTHLALMLNPAIDEETANEKHEPVKSHQHVVGRLEEKDVVVDWIVHGKEALKSLALADRPWTFAYIFCHGQANHPGRAKAQEKLSIDFGVDITPKSVASQKRFSHRPIVMLNSCSSGAFSPLSFDNFYSVLVKRGVCGLVTTHFPVPTLFAARFGSRVMSNYAAGRSDIGDILFQLRRELLQQGNPLGLLYATQCPLEAKAPNVPAAGLSYTRSA